LNKKPVNLIIHGHFYQPPREDPWTNEIDNQSSAYPYKNWNYRIAAECYGPNGYSRVLDEKGLINEIINNYQYLSFNFGPTLLTWLENKEPDIYNHIIEGDKKSVIEHNGHGNAIAQIYNHVIMPLQSFEDKITQVIWGLKDFEYRFGRKSEGIWLAETAVDYKTIDILIEQKIKFIVLSPLQAIAIRKKGNENWIAVGKSGIDSSIPYLIKRTHGEIAVFFYDKQLSTSISFEHLLRNADDLSYKIANASNNDNGVIVIATDGEIYGHHEPFGDMCLSSLISRFHKNGSKLHFTNFGETLAQSEIIFEVNLFMGDDELGSSWSCAHGVGRWYKDCGCQTGGQSNWNQQWRTPLREAFTILKKDVDALFINLTSDFINDPWDVRNDYIDFILSEYQTNKNECFIDKHLTREINDSEKDKLFKLLEAQKLSLFSFTSCGWFFSEVTGIETVQNIKFATKALMIIEEFGSVVRGDFLEKLKEAQSNIPELHDALWVFNTWILTDIQDKKHIANNFIALLESGKNIRQANLSLTFSFDYKNYKMQKLSLLSNVYRGEIIIIDKTSNIQSLFTFLYIKSSGIGYSLYITGKENEQKLISHKDLIISNNYQGESFYTVLSEKDLILEVKNTLLETDINSTIKKVYNRNADSIGDVKEIMTKYKEIHISLSTELSNFIKNTVEIYLHKISQELNDFPDETLEHNILSIFDLINHFSIKIDAMSLKKKFSDILYTSLSENTDTDSDVYNNAIKFIDFTNKSNIIIEKSRLENRIFDILKNKLPAIVSEINEDISENNKVKLMIKIRKIIMLAEKFNINTTEEKKTFFSNF